MCKYLFQPVCIALFATIPQQKYLTIVLAVWENQPNDLAGFSLFFCPIIFADAGLRGGCIQLKSSSGCYMMAKT